MTPTIILLYFSSPSQLGPLGAMVLTLAFPVALELYGLARKRKPSALAIVSIIGMYHKVQASMDRERSRIKIMDELRGYE